MKFDFGYVKGFIDDFAELIKLAIATIKTFVESWKKPIDIDTDESEGE